MRCVQSRSRVKLRFTWISMKIKNSSNVKCEAPRTPRPRSRRDACSGCLGTQPTRVRQSVGGGGAKSITCCEHLFKHGILINAKNQFSRRKTVRGGGAKSITCYFQILKHGNIKFDLRAVSSQQSAVSSQQSH